MLPSSFIKSLSIWRMRIIPPFSLWEFATLVHNLKALFLDFKGPKEFPDLNVVNIPCHNWTVFTTFLALSTYRVPRIRVQNLLALLFAQVTSSTTVVGSCLWSAVLLLAKTSKFHLFWTAPQSAFPSGICPEQLLSSAQLWPACTFYMFYLAHFEVLHKRWLVELWCCWLDLESTSPYLCTVLKVLQPV